ncbi:MAG: carboxypeptidase regulatory-like domain-containing protein [Deltaproteobacteria bacterium]|nr:carboxypeptidase regulatory-like domain-containing protein [Deltaproteobacteria bacterium]
MSRTIHYIMFTVTGLLLAGCGSNLPADNRFDPQGTGEKAKGRIIGVVYVEGLSTQGELAVHLTDSAGAEAAPGLLTADDGTFASIELASGTYRVSVDVPVGNIPIQINDVKVYPGRTTDVGLLTSLQAPATGRVFGRVTLANATANLAAVRVAATRISDDVTETRVTSCDTSGNYSLGALQAGAYEVRADLSGFTPDVVSIDIPAAGSDTQAQTETCGASGCEASELKLYPASAVLRFSVSTASGEVLGAPYTQNRNVSLVMLAFGGVNEMRFSESPDFIEGGIEVLFRDYLAEVPVTLSDGEGEKIMYAQFRVMSATGVERLRTETYHTSVIYDATPPLVVSLTAAPSALSWDGKRYLTTDPSSVPVEVVAFDPYSLVAGVKLLVEGADKEAQPYVQLSSTSASMTYFDVVSLSPSDGGKQIGVILIDGAGNASALTSTMLTIDTTGPTAASVVIDSGLAYAVSRNVWLTLNATDALAGVANVAIANNSIDCTTAAYEPFVFSRSWTLELGDGTKQVWACFKDGVGNTTTANNSIILDTTPPGTPDLTVDELTDRYTTVHWSIPSDIDLAGFTLERRLDNEGSYTIVAAALSPGVTSYTDLIDAADLGHARYFRIRAFDTHGLYSSYSIDLRAGVPTGRSTVTYMNPYDPDERALGWTRPAGTVLLLGTYRYTAPDGTVMETALPTNAVFTRLQSDRERYNEQLVLLGQNTDATLTWQTTFNFGSQRQTLTTLGTNWLDARLALAPDGTPHIIWGNTDPSWSFYYQKLDGTSDPVLLESNADRYADVAVDANGLAHVVWMHHRSSPLEYYLYHQVMDGVSTAQLISSTAYTNVRIAIDSNNISHIVGWAQSGANLAYVKVIGASPTVEILDTTNDVGRAPSIAIDKNDIPHISYQDWTAKSLKYLKKDGTAVPQTLDSSTVVGSVSSIDIDPTNEIPVIAYLDSTNSQAKLIRIGSPASVIASNVVGNIQLAVDNWGVAHVSFVGTSGALRYFVVDGVDTPRDIDSRGLPGQHGDMVIDDLGRLHFLHRNEDTSTLEYARLESAGTWARIAGSSTVSSDYVDIAVDNTNTATVVHIIDWGTLTTTKVARRKEVVTIDVPGSYRWPSIDFDALGQAHIAYHDYNNTRLKYFRTGLSPTTLDNSTAVGVPNDIAVTAEGIAHITYVDSTGILKYIRSDTGTAEIFDSTAHSYLLPSIDLDPGGVPHVAYAFYKDQAIYNTLAGQPATLVGMSSNVAIAVDAHDIGHIAGQDNSGTSLTYVSNCTPPQCNAETLDQSVDGTASSVAIDIDATGVAHIAYFAPDFDNMLGYLRVDGMSRPQRLLTRSAVCPVLGSCGDMQSLAMELDSRGVAHIGLYTFDGSDIGQTVYAHGQYAQRLNAAKINEVVIPAVCKDSEFFGPDMIGCAGTFTWSQRSAVCTSAGLTVCTAQNWVDRHRQLAPQYNYWTDDALQRAGTGTGDCYVSTTGGTACSPATAPMRVCAGATDTLGNACTWYNCGREVASPNEYFGGCDGNITAGVLCCTP